MKFLVDHQLPRALAAHLRAAGHDCQHVLEVGLAQASDTSTCRYALSQERILISKDEDFVYFSTHPDFRVRLIWVRLGNCRTPALLAAFDRFWPKIEACLVSGDRIVELR